MSDLLSLPAGKIYSDGTVSFGSDDRLIVTFFLKEEQHAYRSEQEGRPIFVSEEMIRIQQPGERDVFVGKATQDKIERFPRHYAAFKAGLEPAPDGTPLTILFPAEPHISREMKALQVHTVEQLAGLQENAIARLGLGGRSRVEKAKAYLAQAGNAAPFHQLRRENEELQERMALMQQQIDALRAPRDDDETPRRRGRPPKGEE
jgi:hypothetical protein